MVGDVIKSSRDLYSALVCACSTREEQNEVWKWIDGFRQPAREAALLSVIELSGLWHTQVLDKKASSIEVVNHRALYLHPILDFIRANP